MTFADRFRDLRAALGWSRKHLGRYIGMSRQAVLKVEEGMTFRLRTPHLLNLRKLEKAYARELECYRSQKASAENRAADRQTLAGTGTVDQDVNRKEIPDSGHAGLSPESVAESAANWN